MLTVTIPTSGQASLAWTFDPGNSAALVQWRKTGTPGWSQFLPPNSNQLTLTGLDPTASYDVQVVQLPTGKLLTAASFKPTPTPVGPVAPVLTSKNGVISWPAQAGVTAWKGAISDGSGAGGAARNTTYVDLGNVTSWSPAAVPGKTLYYGLAAMPSGPWASPEVAIAWPIPVPAPSKVVIGINDGLGWGPESGPAVKDAHLWVRANYESGQTTELPANLLANGLTPGCALIANTDDATPLSKIDVAQWLSIATAQADDAVKQCGIGIPLEVGNEMYLKSPQAEPVAYAKMFDALAKARPTYTFLFSMTGDYMRPDGTWSQQGSGNGWLGDAVAAVPALKTEIGGFVAHPYGDMKPVPHNSGNTWGPGALPVWHDTAVKLGCVHADRFHLTEYGSTYPTAGDGDLQYVDCQVAYAYFMGFPWVRSIYWFAFRDYVGMTPPKTGAFNDDFTPRPVVGTLKSLAIGQGQ